MLLKVLKENKEMQNISDFYAKELSFSRFMIVKESFLLISPFEDKLYNKIFQSYLNPSR